MPNSTPLHRELRLFALGYGLSLAVLVGLGVLLSWMNGTPAWKQLLTLENPACIYGACYVLAGVGYLILRFVVGLVSLVRAWRRPLS